MARSAIRSRASKDADAKKRVRFSAYCEAGLNATFRKALIDVGTSREEALDDSLRWWLRQKGYREGAGA